MSTPQPWYKQFWPWFLIILPLCAVVASINLLMVAIDNQDPLVTEDYYKEGKGINIDLRKIKQAKQLGMNYLLEFDDKYVEISQHGGDTYLAALSISFFHPTLAERDFSQIVTADANGIYRIDLEQPISGPWEVRIEGYDQTWRIQQRVTLKDDQEYWLN
ncbi:MULTISPECIES: FixH family protein [Shewanella]|uniref:FixH family protein n=1 Tax=Shewanella fidelis TaxID=173509 RepID=A0AAW8NLW9_9GAMM|nr:MULTISPECIES: FixH family protein [Shewanella]MDR8523867.1 FixH family protein [Shewanella fidelis]MDW4810414.1 FixH family protein [Shewanella fidelis]MDW4814535.1 FixH family protein [Shewanella fidelis]MDW4818625.1 FixH family protein [Shewanella fidelis]MDW4823698.1 FixH family protein [Shewanella fidelis]